MRAGLEGEVRSGGGGGGGWCGLMMWEGWGVGGNFEVWFEDAAAVVV